VNILTSALPVTVDINGEIYLINTDFRAALRVILAFEDPDLTAQEKQIVMLSNLYPVVPSDVSGALEQANLFLNAGKLNGEGEAGPRVYSFAKDANYIFAAFRQTHGIDLETAELHWWKFLALFMDLGSETTFCQLIGLRKRLKTGKASKEERQAAREMGDILDVPDIDDSTLEEREAEAAFMEAVKQSNHNV
jgi:hypothetical protein